MSSAGLWDYETGAPSASSEPLDLEHYIPGTVEWRLGTPDWQHAKLIFSERDDDRTVFEIGLSPNTHYDHTNGWSDRDIRSMLYFGEMANGYLAMTLEH